MGTIEAGEPDLEVGVPPLRKVGVCWAVRVALLGVGGPCCLLPCRPQGPR